MDDMVGIIAANTKRTERCLSGVLALGSEPVRFLVGLPLQSRSCTSRSSKIWTERGEADSKSKSKATDRSVGSTRAVSLEANSRFLTGLAPGSE